MTLQETLKAGLRPTNRAKRNAPVLVECTGVRPSPFGLSPYEAFTDAISASELSDNSITPAWPFPQIFRGSQITLLVTQTGLWTVDESDWTLTAVTTYDASNDANTKAIDSGGSWQFVDFQNCWLLFNGTCIVYKRADNAKVLVRTRAILTACEHGQRLFIGGLSQIWNSSWDTLVGTWLANTEPAAFDDSLATPENMVFWTNVGSLGLFWLLLDTTSATVGELTTHAASDPWAHFLMMRGDWGFAPTPYPGSVYALKSLNNSVIAYCEGGVAALTPGGTPLPSCAVTPLSPVGIYGRNSVAASKARHLWLSARSELFQTDTNGLTRLDFGEYGALLDSGTVIGSADEEEGILFLSDGDVTLMQTEQGVAKAPECPTSIIHAGTATRAITFAADNVGVEITTSPIDFGFRGLKTVDDIRVAGALPIDGTATVRVDYRDSGSAAFANDTAVAINDEGVAHINITADEFQFAVLVPAYANVSIDYIEVTYRVRDARYTERMRPRAIEA